MKKLAPLLVIVAGSLWGCMGILVRGMNKIGLETMEIVAVRCLVTGLCMAAGLLIGNRRALRIHLKDLWCFIGTGICSIVFFNYCYFKTITEASLSMAAILLYTAPAIVMILSALLFGETMTRKKMIALALTFAGCVCVAGAPGKEGITAAGLFTGLGAGLGYALYSIFGRCAINRGYHSLTITLWTFVIAAAGCLPLIGVKHIIDSFAAHPTAVFSSMFWIFMTTVLAYILYTLGLQHMETGRASVITSIEPVVASLVGIFLFGEPLTVGIFLGMCLVIGAIALIN